MCALTTYPGASTLSNIILSTITDRSVRIAESERPPVVPIARVLARR